MAKWRKITGIILISVTVALIGYDIFIVIKQPEATLSNVIMSTLWKFPLIGYAWAVLLGHFLSIFKTEKTYIKWLIIISLAVLLISIITAAGSIKLSGPFIGFMGLLGFCVGTATWSQRRK